MYFNAIKSSFCYKITLYALICTSFLFSIRSISADDLFFKEGDLDLNQGRSFTMNDFQQLSSDPESGKVVIIFEGHVFDLTELINQHRGGADAILRANGRDMTQVFKEERTNHLKFRLFREFLVNHYLGELIDENDAQNEEQESTTSSTTKVFPFFNSLKFMLKGMDKLSNNPEEFRDQKDSVMGLDIYGFGIWNHTWAHTPLKKVLGPTYYITDKKAIDTVLNMDKIGFDKNPMDGNLSSLTIGKMFGDKNIFNPDSIENHKKYRNIFISAFDQNRELIKTITRPIINSFFQGRKKITLPRDSDELAAFIMIRLLFGEDKENSKELYKALFSLKYYFNSAQAKTTFNQIFKTKPNLQKEITLIRGYMEQSTGLSLLDHMNEDPSLSSEVKEQMLMMLFTVGHNNFASALASNIYRLSAHPEYQGLFLDHTEHEGEFNVSTYKEGRKFFYEVLRIHPPVWLQARKVKGSDLVLPINGVNTKIEVGSLLLFPNIVINRDDSSFNPERFEDTRKTTHYRPHFSTGPNNCPGQYMAVPAIEEIMEFLFTQYQLKLINPEQGIRPLKVNGGIALSYAEDIEISLEQRIQE